MQPLPPGKDRWPPDLGADWRRGAAHPRSGRLPTASQGPVEVEIERAGAAQRVLQERQHCL